MYVFRAFAVILFIQQTSVCLSAPADPPPASPSSTDAIPPAQVVKDAAANATAEAVNKFNSVPGLLNEVNEFTASSVTSAGNAVIDAARNFGNIGTNAAGQLVSTVGMAGELLGVLTGGLFTTGGQIFSQLTGGIGSGLNQGGKTFGSSFKDYGALFTNLGSGLPSVGGHTQASGAGARLSTRDYTWQG